MTDHESRYFTLSLESLQAIGGWAADCAERALSVYETHADSDSRPRAAIEGIREFAAGGSVERAQTAVRKILHTHTVAPLSADVQSAVKETINAYAA